MRPLGRALVQSEGCPCTRRRLDTDATVQVPTPREEAQLWAASQGQRPQKKPLPIPRLDSSLQNSEKMNLVFEPPDCGTLSWQLDQINGAV